MSIILDPQSKLKRQMVLAVLILPVVGTTIATIIHRLELTTNPLHLINPPLFAITFLYYWYVFIQSPKSYNK